MKMLVADPDNTEDVVLILQVMMVKLQEIHLMFLVITGMLRELNSLTAAA